MAERGQGVLLGCESIPKCIVVTSRKLPDANVSLGEWSILAGVTRQAQHGGMKVPAYTGQCLPLLERSCPKGVGLGLSWAVPTWAAKAKTDRVFLKDHLKDPVLIPSICEWDLTCKRVFTGVIS